MKVGFSKDKRDFMAEETFLSLACFSSSANKSLLNLILLGDICYWGGVLSFTKHRDCTLKTYMKTCKYSSGMTVPLPPDRAVQPCQNTGRGREVRQCPWGQNALPSSSQLFLSKAVLNLRMYSLTRTVVSHTVPNCAPDEWNCHHIGATNWNLIKQSTWMLSQPHERVMSMRMYFKILTISPQPEMQSFKVSFSASFWRLWT